MIGCNAVPDVGHDEEISKRYVLDCMLGIICECCGERTSDLWCIQ